MDYILEGTWSAEILKIKTPEEIVFVFFVTLLLA